MDSFHDTRVPSVSVRTLSPEDEAKICKIVEDALPNDWKDDPFWLEHRSREYAPSDTRVHILPAPVDGKSPVVSDS